MLSYCIITECVGVGMPATLQGQCTLHYRKLFLSFRVAVYKISHTFECYPPKPHSSPAPSKFQTPRLPHTPDYFSPGLWVCCCCALNPHSPAVLLGARIQGRGGQGCWLFMQMPRTMAGWLQRCPANEYQPFYLYSEMWRQMGEGGRGEKQPYTEAQIAS